MVEIATKRIPVTPETWEKLSEMKRPGQTYDELLGQMIVHEQCIRFHDDMKRTEQHGKFIPLDEFEAFLEIKK